VTEESAEERERSPPTKPFLLNFSFFRSPPLSSPPLSASLPSPRLLSVYAQIKKDEDAKYAAQLGEADAAIIKSLQNAKTVVIDVKHPNKAALVAQLDAAVDAVKANLVTAPFTKSTPTPTPTPKVG
jgi:methionine synthase II (cobalamin-independent)